MVEIGMAEMHIGRSPEILITRGLGSCLGITVYDPAKKIGALAHVMLPDITNARIKHNPYRFVNSAIDAIVEELKVHGSLTRNMKAKIFGGAHMFSFMVTNTILNIGEKNVLMAKQMFARWEIPVLAEDVRGNFGRTIEFYLDTGKVMMRTVSQGEKEY